MRGLNQIYTHYTQFLLLGVVSILAGSLLFALVPFTAYANGARVSPLMKRLSDNDLKKSRLEVSTTLTVPDTKTIELELVKAVQQEDGTVKWVPADKGGFFKLPFKKKVFSAGRHTLTFTRLAPPRRLIDPLVYAVAITSEEKTARITGSRDIKLRASVNLRQIFQITHPGSVRGVRRYPLSISDAAVDRAGFLELKVKNQGGGAFYIKPSVRLFSRTRSGTRSERNMFVTSDITVKKMNPRLEVPIYPGAVVGLQADVRDYPPGQYTATVTIITRDSLGSRKVIRSVKFKKTSIAKKAAVRAASVRGIKLSSKTGRYGTELQITSPILTGLLTVSSQTKDPVCAPRASSILAKRQTPSRISLPKLNGKTCTLRVLHGDGEIMIQVTESSAYLLKDLDDQGKLKKDMLKKGNKGKK